MPIGGWPAIAATSQNPELFNDYDGFVEKFKPKRTTDDCYTPPEVMEVVNAYVADRWGLDPATFVRPFFPGGDYERFDYPDGCCVVDNPPFSILSKIKRFYLDRGIRFFLFCPSLTALSGKEALLLTVIACDASVTYENGVVVRTAFVTNMGGDVVIESAPELGRSVNEASERAARSRAGTTSLPRYEYPDAVVTAAMVQRYSKCGIRYQVRRSDCCRIHALDAQRAVGKSIFGAGLLLSERAAAERAAAERARAHVWELSDRERAMQAMLGGGD